MESSEGLDPAAAAAAMMAAIVADDDDDAAGESNEYGNDFNSDNQSEHNEVSDINKVKNTSITAVKDGGPSKSAGECVALHISCPNIGVKADVELIVSICEIDSTSTDAVTYSKVIASGTMSGLQIGFYRSFFLVPERKYRLKMEFRGGSIQHHTPQDTKYIDLKSFGPTMVELHPSIVSHERRHSVASGASTTASHPPAYLLVQYFPVFDTPSIYVGPSTIILPGSHSESSWQQGDTPQTNFIVYLDDAHNGSTGSSSSSGSASVAEVLDGVYRTHRSASDAVHAHNKRPNHVNDTTSGPQHGAYILARAVFEGSFTSPSRPTSASSSTSSPSHHDHFNKAFRGRADSFQHHGANHYPSIPSSWAVPKIETMELQAAQASDKPFSVTTTAFQQHLHVEHNSSTSMIYNMNEPLELLASLVVPESHYYDSSNLNTDTDNKVDDAAVTATYSVWGVGMLKEIDRHPLRHFPSSSSSHEGASPADDVVVVLEGKLLRNHRPSSAAGAGGNIISNAVQAVSTALSQLGHHNASDPMSLLRTAANNATPVVVRVAVLLKPTETHPLAVTNRNLITKKVSSSSRPSSASAPAPSTQSPEKPTKDAVAASGEDDDSNNNVAAAAAAMLSRADSMRPPVDDKKKNSNDIETEESKDPPTISSGGEDANNKNKDDDSDDQDKPSSESEVLDKMHQNNSQYSPRSAHELDDLVAESIAELDGEDDPDNTTTTTTLGSSPSVAFASAKQRISNKNNAGAADDSNGKAMRSIKAPGAPAVISAKAGGSSKTPNKSIKDPSPPIAAKEDEQSTSISSSTKQKKERIPSEESEMRSKSTFEPSPDPVSAAVASLNGMDDDVDYNNYEGEEYNWEAADINPYTDEGPTYEGLLAQNKSLKKAIDECRVEITGLRSDNTQYKASLQDKARKDVEDLQRNEDMARMLTELVQQTNSPGENSKIVAGSGGPIKEFHHHDLVQLSKAQLLALAQIAAIKYIDIKGKLLNEQSLQQEAADLKLKLQAVTQSRDDLESNMFLQNKYLQKMQKQIAQVENYRSTISMQEKVIAKMQSVVESKINATAAVGLNPVTKVGAIPTKPMAASSNLSPLASRILQNNNNNNNNNNVESERIQQELQQEKDKTAELEQELEAKKQSLAYVTEDLRLMQEELSKLKNNNESISEENDALNKEKTELKHANNALQNELKSLKAAHAKLDDTDKDHLLTTIDRLEAEATARDIRVQALEEQLNIQAVEGSRRIADLQMRLFEAEINANLESDQSPERHSRYDRDHSSGRNSRSGERDHRDYDDRRTSRRSSRRLSHSPRHSPRSGSNVVAGFERSTPSPEIVSAALTQQEDTGFQSDVSQAVAAHLNSLNSIPENTKTLSNSNSKSSIGIVIAADKATAGAPTSRPTSRPGSKGSQSNAATAGSGSNAAKDLRVTTELEGN